MTARAKLGAGARELLAFLMLVALVATSSCRGPSGHDPPTPTAQKEHDAAPRPAPFARCLEPPSATLEPVPPLAIAGVPLVQLEDRLVVQNPAPAPDPSQRLRPLKLGLLADTRQATPETLRALERLVAQMARAEVDAIVVLGGIDATFEGTRQILRRIGTTRPLLALPGDSVSREGFRAAVRELGPGAVDLTIVHIVELPRVTLVAVPGYFRPHHHRAGSQGCSYDASALSRLAAAVRRTRRPRVLLAYGPPRGQGPAAVDRSFGATHIGDAQLNALMRGSDLTFGCFAHDHEAAGHATTVTGTRVPPRAWSASLLLSVGSADATVHEHLERGWIGPTGALFEIDRNRARFEMLELPALYPPSGLGYDGAPCQGPDIGRHLP